MHSNIFTLRQAIHGEEAALAELRVLAMRESLEKVGRFDPIRARTRFLETFVPAETHHILVAAETVGFMVLRSQPDLMHLDHLYIHPAQQCKGLGKAVLQRVFSEASRLGRSVRVGALKSSRSNQFYLRHGFCLVEQGEWDNYYVWHGAGAA